MSEDELTTLFHDFKTLYGENSINLAKNRQDKITGTQHIKKLKILGDYVPLWEKVLLFYRLANEKENKKSEL
ncbi:hypothetical protein [Peribacillus sp. ACCC06369]|uniref:hypothetical protein n=1 Tax=Peribacillus sp. ACCC06369 TaxID=3055860 RepID=UPI0025A1A88A|nr:hypothetical protein [Peribacillus sp. ACCC06369]MDM5358810.1 hypothetical protein [Peribacillus sp. ACCC06369]